MQVRGKTTTFRLPQYLGYLVHSPRNRRIFREHPERLSLSVHGNNHTKRELGRAYSEDREGRSYCRQAIQRIERFERRTGLAVSRVMVPPYGACSEEMLAALPRYGFEAACISHGSLRFHNKTRAWTKNLGFLPSEMIEGCPVLPRWGLTGPTTNSILLAAFLKQAIILQGTPSGFEGWYRVA